MKSTLTTILAFSMLTGAAAAQSRGPAERVRTVVRETTAPRHVLYQRGAHQETERITKTLRIGTSGELVLANLAGPIFVSRGGSGEATVEIVKTARAASPESAREMLKFVTVAIDERGSRAEIKAHYPSERRLNVTVAYTVTAPAGTRLTIRSMSGGIKVTDILGDLVLDTMSGNVDVSGASRIATANSVSGNVTITGTKTDGGVEASSVSGNVTLHDVHARRLTLNSVSGHIVIENAACERADAKTMSGNVSYSGTLARNGRYEMKSHSGDVRLQVAGGSGFEIDASTFSGSIRSDLALTTPAGQTLASRGRQRSFRGTYGDGSAVVSITSFSGSVLIGK